MSATTNVKKNVAPSKEERLFARNMAWLAERHSHLGRRIEEMSEGRFDKPLRERGRIVNLETGGTRLYDPNAPLHAAQEMKEYFAKKKLFLMYSDRMGENDTHEPSEREDIQLARDLTSVFVKDGGKSPRWDKPSRKERSLLVVFGLGLGYHITPLLQRLKPCNVCIVETRRENAFFAARTQDFTRWSRLCAQRHGNVFLVVEEDVEALERNLTYVLAENLHFFVNNFFFYRHATLGATLKRLEGRMADIVQNSVINKGFFEDQLLMQKNSASNLAARETNAFLTPGLRLRQKKEALILANGPSLDDALPYLKRLCRGRVVFSCGSTLYTLLKNGIVPHYHCEIENIFPEANHLVKIRAEGYSLDAITLLASVTVEPEVVAAFPMRVFFSRPSVPFSYVNDFKPLVFAVPTVANTALCCAQNMGFSTFYMLGVDCGYKQGRLHHAKDAVHFLDEKYKKSEDERQEKSRLVFRGNFGGYVRSQEVLFATKQMLEFAVRKQALSRYYNCSDGVQIKGFVPLLPSLIETLNEGASPTHNSDTSHNSCHNSCHNSWHDACPRLSLADPTLRVRTEKAQQKLDLWAKHLERLFATLQETESIADLQELYNGLKDIFVAKGDLSPREGQQGWNIIQELHKELKALFASENVEATHAEQQSLALVHSFYIGSVFIMFSQIYQCFLIASKPQWLRVRRQMSAHVQRHLRSMRTRLQHAFTEELERVRQACQGQGSQ